MRLAITTAIVLLFALAPATAGASAPPNDNRATPQVVTLPAGVNGTTVDATVEANEPPASCGPEGPSVWYAFTATQNARVIADLHAFGDLDAVVHIFQRIRSQINSGACDQTNPNGDASLTFDVKKGETFLVRVAQLTNSVPDQFHLDLIVAAPPATPPGQALPSAGTALTLDRAHSSLAWSVFMQEGQTYRINAVRRSGACVPFRLYPPNTASFTRTRFIKQLRCGGYTLFTPGPGQGGRFSILAESAIFRRSVQRYHLQVAAASRDDTAPGIFSGNYQRIHGSLRGDTIDVADLYRFTIGRRSDLNLTLATKANFKMTLLTDGGRRIATGSTDLHWRIKPGRYFVEVRARRTALGHYTFERVSREITKTHISINGGTHKTTPPGTTARIGVHVAPSESGPVAVDIQRFDPVQGWQFFHRYTVHVAGGTATLPFHPPSVGRWRAMATFLGTRAASGSATGWATLLVAEPLPKVGQSSFGWPQPLFG